MIIRDKLPTTKRLSTNVRFPDHPGDPKWRDLDEWRHVRESAAIEMQQKAANAARFALDNSSWGSINEDAADAGWGMPDNASSQSWGMVNDPTDNGWGTASAASDQGWRHSETRR